VIDADYINKAYERVMAGDVKFRFVIDVQKSLLMDA
jgi:D-arabinose 1-dehydrogenase-like Zn-dependent alcohol dehydrogenase